MTDQALTLGSYQGFPCHHWDEELPLVAALLERYRPHFVLELGTMYGGFAAFLADTVSRWQGQVLTVDHVIYPGLQEVLTPRRDNLKFLVADLNEPTTFDLLLAQAQAAASRDASLCLYVDCGHEHRLTVLQRFTRLFRLIGIHDYATEVTVEACETWATQWGYDLVEAAAFAALQCAKGGYFVSRFWSRQSASA